MTQEQWLAQSQSLRVMVIGDLMLDRYIWGRVARISPEAPVPIVEVSHEESRLGGAANVALNVSSLGAQPILCGVLGEDLFGQQFLDLVADQGFDQQGLILTKERPTTVKTRVLGNRQQVLRVDREVTDYLSPTMQTLLKQKLTTLLPTVDGVIFQDYDKGVLTPGLIRFALEVCEQAAIPTFVDPKFRQFEAYRGCTWFKPNLKELSQGLGTTIAGGDMTAIAAAIQTLRDRMPHAYTLVTLSEHGMALRRETDLLHIPAHLRDIADVSGAGDTVISVAALAILMGMEAHIAAQYANLAGGLVCEEVGVVSIQLARLLAEEKRLNLG